MPDTRPGIKFYEGKCIACINYQKQKSTDGRGALGRLRAVRGLPGFNNSPCDSVLQRGGVAW